MILPFDFATAHRLRFGAGVFDELPRAIDALGLERVLIVTGRRAERGQALARALDALGVECTLTAALGEPSVEGVREGVALAREDACDGVIAVGGGSALDTGKAIAALVPNGEVMEHLEVVGKGRPFERPSLPFVAVPTTAGTGSEVTRNAVLSVKQSGVKASLRGASLLPTLAVVDPELLSGAPPEVLRDCGLDALSQLIEAYLSIRANPLTDALAREGIARSARSLRQSVLGDPERQEREDLALASVLGGMCLANAGLGAVHGFAAPMGGLYGAPHGAVCAALLVPVLEVNLQALKGRAPQSPSLARYRDLAVLLTGQTNAAPEHAIAVLRALCEDLGVRGLSSFGLSEAGIPELVRGALRSSSMKGNPLPLSERELEAVVRGAMSTQLIG